jgi:hypothetical protein
MADVVQKYRNGFSGPYFDDPKYFYDTSDRGDKVIEIYQVIVNSGTRVDGLQLVWRDIKGGTITSTHIGGPNGTFYPPWPDHQLTEPFIAIRGKLGEYGQDPQLRLFAIQFSTKSSTSPIYGDQSFNPDDTKDHRNFYYECPDGYQIIDIFGWADQAVNAIGVYIEPIPTP